MFCLTKKLLLEALDRAPAATAVLADGPQGITIVYANQALAGLTGWPLEELVGTPLERRIQGSSGIGTAAAVGGPAPTVLQRWRHRRGGECQIHFRLAPLTAGSERTECWLLSQLPAVAGQHDGSGVAITPTPDPVTGLPDARSLEARLAADWAAAKAAGRRVSLVLFRVDALDAYRDLFGRHATDSCLRMVGHAINGSLRREGDFAARADDDVFAVLIGGADEQQATDFAGRIERKVRMLAIHHPRSRVARFVTVSCGVAAQFPEAGTTGDGLLVAARAALGEAVSTEIRTKAG